LQIDEFKCAWVANATAHHKVQFLHGLAFFRGEESARASGKTGSGAQASSAENPSGIQF
jgi:hypothetical protein